MRYLDFLKDVFSGERKNYLTRLSRAFPSEYKSDVHEVFKALPIYDHDVQRTAHGKSRVDNFIHEKEQRVILRGESIVIPSRIYFNEANSAVESRLTKSQGAILDCIYLRHHDGYIRQRHLERLNVSDHYFVCPFVISLLGEYVVEILESIVGSFTPEVPAQFGEFLADNRFFWKQTQSRMISYWDVYYRDEYPYLSSYVGKRLVDKLDEVVLNYENISRADTNANF